LKIYDNISLMKSEKLLTFLNQTRAAVKELRGEAAPRKLGTQRSAEEILELAESKWTTCKLGAKTWKPYFFTSRSLGTQISQPMLAEGHLILAKAAELLRRKPLQDLAIERWNPCGSVMINGYKGELDIYPRQSKGQSLRAILRLTYYDQVGHQHQTIVAVPQKDNGDIAVTKENVDTRHKAVLIRDQNQPLFIELIRDPKVMGRTLEIPEAA
jgi:hypothetical protein